MKNNNICCKDGIGRLHKIAGIVIADKKVLAVRKRGTKEYIIPGGGHEVGETHIDTLRRELKEEVQLELVNAEFLNQYLDKALWSDEMLLAHIYLAEIKGTPSVANEIEEFRWIDKDFQKNGLILGSILADFVFPELIKRKLV